MPYVTETLIQNTGETDSDFVIRVNTFIADQAYFYETIGGGYPPAPFGSRSFKGFPPDKPSSDIVFYDSVAAQAKRIVTFSYENTYYYIYIGASPPIPGPPPSPTVGNIVIWGPSATLNDGALQINTLAPNFINLSPATVAGEAVEYSQFTSALSGYVPTSRNITINGVTQDLSADRTWTVVGGVTSVGMSMPSEFSVTGSPVTGSGVLTASWLPVTGGYVLAGPAPGSPSATPSFRPLGALDIPDISATYLKVSTAALTYYPLTNPSGYISGITSSDVITALGYTPYDSANPAGYITTAALSGYLTTAAAAATYQPIGSYLTTISGLNVSLLINDSGYITSSALSGYLTSATAASTYYPLTNPSGYISAITSGDVTTALGFTPYDSANPAGYITTSALLGYLTSATAASTYYPLTNPSGYISGITSGDVTTALGFTPVNNAGDTMTGLLQFSGTGHAGVRLNNLTTAQRTALSATAGMAVFDTSLGALAQYTGTYWKYEQEKVATNTTTTVITAANITGLSHTLEANSIYKVEGYYSVVCNNTGGIKFTQTVPSGATVEVNYDGIAGTAATSIKIRSTASGTLTPNAINTANLSSGVMVSGVITTAATAGTVQFQFASGVATQTSTITPRSFVKLTKVG